MKSKTKPVALLLMAMLLNACAINGRVTDSFWAVEWISQAPIGYTHFTNQKGKPDIMIDPVRAPLVRQLFEKYATGCYSISQLVTMARDIEETQDFAMGDRIMFRENNRNLGVMNGTFGTLQAIKGKDFHVRLDNGKTVQFSPQDYRAFQLGYAATVHKSQGVTVDEAFILATPHFDRHTTYVAMSRHKQNVQLYARAGLSRSS